MTLSYGLVQGFAKTEETRLLTGLSTEITASNNIDAAILIYQSTVLNEFPFNDELLKRMTTIFNKDDWSIPHNNFWS
jgi:hypothetical protein